MFWYVLVFDLSLCAAKRTHTHTHVKLWTMVAVNQLLKTHVHQLLFGLQGRLRFPCSRGLRLRARARGGRPEGPGGQVQTGDGKVSRLNPPPSSLRVLVARHRHGGLASSVTRSLRISFRFFLSLVALGKTGALGFGPQSGPVFGGATRSDGGARCRRSQDFEFREGPLGFTLEGNLVVAVEPHAQARTAGFLSFFFLALLGRFSFSYIFTVFFFARLFWGDAFGGQVPAWKLFDRERDMDWLASTGVERPQVKSLSWFTQCLDFCDGSER